MAFRSIQIRLKKVKKDYMHDLMVESSEKGTCNDEKQMTLNKAC